MSATAITQLAAYTTFHADDVFVIVDRHDTSMASTGTDKYISLDDFWGSLTGDVTVDVAVTSFAATIANNAVTTAKLNNNAVTTAKMATGSANSLAGYDGSGNFGGVTVGANLTLAAGVLSATGGGGGG